MPIHYISPEVLKKFRGKTCLLRIDLNAKPGLEKKFLRVDAVLPTIRMLLKNGNRLIVLSHRGQPSRNPKLSLRPFLAILSKKLKQNIKFVSDFRIPEKGRVFLLENLRFWKGEEDDDVKFAKRLSSLGDFYVNDAFAVSHRKNASVHVVTRFLPSLGGLLLKKEIENLDSVLRKAKKPLVVVIGGAKVGDKLGVINNLWGKADYFLLGSGPAATFFVAEGLPVGESLVDRGSVSKIRRFIGSKKIVLPIDVKMEGKKILDVGEGTTRKYSTFIGKARTIVWNGPIGRFERKEFSNGTKAIWSYILKNKKARIVIGGGETLASLRLLKSGKMPKKVFLSTGGGAMLEYLSGKKLPGIEALKK